MMEDIVFIVFVGTLGCLYAFCIRSLWLARMDGWGQHKFSRLEWSLFGMAGLGIICFAYSLCEPYQLSISKVQMSSLKIAKGEDPIRIVHITDLHSDGIDRLESRLPAEVAALKPDLIVFTGDSANNRDGLALFRKCITEIAKIAPTFAVNGNHDSRGGRLWDIYGNTGVQLLNGASKTISIRGTKVCVAGVSVDRESAILDAFSDVSPDAFSIFLYHYPSGIDTAVAKKVDLFCAGHTHGGQVCLPFYGAIVTNSSKGKQYEYGLYQVGETAMYVSRGIGMIGVPIRFLAPPEIAVIEVLSQVDSPGR